MIKEKKLYKDINVFNEICNSLKMGKTSKVDLENLINRLSINNSTICLEGSLTLRDFEEVYGTTPEGAKKINKRLKMCKAISLIPSDKYHDNSSYVIINSVFLKCFFLG